MTEKKFKAKVTILVKEDEVFSKKEVNEMGVKFLSNFEEIGEEPKTVKEIIANRFKGIICAVDDISAIDEADGVIQALEEHGFRIIPVVEKTAEERIKESILKFKELEENASLESGKRYDHGIVGGLELALAILHDYPLNKATEFYKLENHKCFSKPKKDPDKPKVPNADESQVRHYQRNEEPECKKGLNYLAHCSLISYLKENDIFFKFWNNLDSESKMSIDKDIRNFLKEEFANYFPKEKAIAKEGLR